MDVHNKLHVIQCNTDKSHHSFNEFIAYFISSKHTIAFISEPYIGARNEVKSLQGLNIYQFPSNGRVKSCIITKSKITCIGLSQFSSPNLCVVRIKTGYKHIHLASAYIEPDTDTHDTLSLIDNFLINTTDTHCILGGDFNGWHPLWGSATSNRRGCDVVDMTHAADLFVCNVGNAPTFETVTHGRVRSSIIDLTFASADIHHQITDWQVNIDACPSSQHNAVDFTYTYTHSHPEPQSSSNPSTYLYKSKKAQWSVFKSALHTQLTNNNTLDVDIHSLNTQQLEEFIDTITDIIHTACKESMPIKSPGHKCTPLWWSDSLEILKKEVIHAHRQLHLAKKHGEPTDNLASELQALKATYAKELKNASTTGFRDFCQLQTKENVWSLTNRLLKDTAPRRPPATLKIGNAYTTDTQDTARAVLNHFYPDDSPDTELRHHDLRAHFNDLPETPDDPPFTPEEVLEILKNMNPKRAPGLDGFTADICLEFSQSYPRLITDILNRCLDLQHFPRKWKEAYVKIIPKPSKTDHTELSSFRPIGLLPVFGKLLEKLFIWKGDARCGQIQETQRQAVWFSPTDQYHGSHQ